MLMKTILVTGSNGLTGQKDHRARTGNESDFNLIATSKGENRFPVKEGYTYAEMDIPESGKC
jgi:dTDP-4-dehydrorhamnose reductase